MNDNFIDYKQLANEIFLEWVSDEESKSSFEGWIDEANKLGCFADWLETDEARDVLLDKLLCFYKDVEDAEEVADKLYTYMTKGINRWFEEA
jgi:hypothetical protein